MPTGVMMVFLGVFVLVVIAGLLLGGGEDEEVKGRISQLASLEDFDAQKEAAAELGAEAALASKKKESMLGNVGKIITPHSIACKLEDMLERADVPLRANEFAAFVFLCFMGAMAVGMLVFKDTVIAVALAAVGFAAPFIWVKMMFYRRLKLFNHQILDTLVLLSNAVKAGYSMLQAMEMVAKETPPPMQKEFARVIREISLGVSIEDALTNMKERVPSDELDLMVTVVLIQRQIGGNLSEILDKIAHTIRERMRIHGEIRTLTAQGRISGMVVGGLPVGLGFILYFINPDYISLLWTYKSGWFCSYYLIILGIVMEIVGGLIILHITNIEV